MKSWRTVALSALLTFLTGCGWHLRGLDSIELPFATLYLQANSVNAELVSQLTSQLSRQNITLSASSLGQYQLILENYREDKRVLTTDSRGRASDYQLTSSVDMQLIDDQQKLLIEPETLELTRSYNFDADNVASAGEEEKLLRKEMKQELARRILLRLQALSPNEPAS